MKITTIHEVSEVLLGIPHELAQVWLHNDIIKKNLALSYDYWLEDTGIPITLTDFVTQYLANAEYLGETFLANTDHDQ